MSFLTWVGMSQRLAGKQVGVAKGSFESFLSKQLFWETRTILSQSMHEVNLKWTLGFGVCFQH